MATRLKAVDDDSNIPVSVLIYNKIRPLERDVEEARTELNEAKKEIKAKGLNKEAHNLCRKYKRKDALEAAAFKKALDAYWAEFGLDAQGALPLDATQPAA